MANAIANQQVEFQVFGTELTVGDGPNRKQGDWLRISRHPRSEMAQVERRRSNYPDKKFQTRWIVRKGKKVEVIES